MLALAIAIPIAFLCGSFPTGLLIARSRGVNIREHGSGNIGATNVWRVLGRGPGLLCFLIDAGKGLAPTLVAGALAGLLGANTPPPAAAWLWLAVVTAAILGHMFSPWAGFRGGKGVATGLGALLGVYPLLTWPALGALAVWLAVARASRYVSLASCAAALTLPLFLAATIQLRSDAPGRHADALPFYAVVSLLALVVVVKHRSNIGRLLRGTENRFGRPPPAAAAPPDQTRPDGR